VRHISSWVLFIIEGGDLKKAKIHLRGRGYGRTRSSQMQPWSYMEASSGNIERAVKHFKIATSAGDHYAIWRLSCIIQTRFSAVR
jgi:hypothetical protein